MRIAANGIELHVEQRGAGTPALVFLHYWGGSSRSWRHVVDRLAPDFRTIAMDQRGWGQSDAPPNGYALADLADDAQAVIKALDLERYILIGHSMGGKVSQLIASRRPDGLMGLVLVAPSPPSPLNLPLDVRRGMVHAYDSRESIIATLESVLAPNGLDPDDLEAVIADSLIGAPAAKQAWPLSASQEDIRASMADIEVPAIVISGACDRVDPPEVLRRELLPHLLQAELHLLPNVGHLLPIEAPDDVADLIRTFALSMLGVETIDPPTYVSSAEKRCSVCGAVLVAVTGQNDTASSDPHTAPHDGKP